MEIKKIKLLSGGFKGAVVTYLKPEVKNGKNFTNKVSEERKYPIHMDMQNPFLDLRYHLLEICGLIRNDMEKMDIDYVIAESDVVSISIEADGFVISGTRIALANKEIKIQTPSVESGDGYHHFDTVMKIIEKIIEETHQYLNGAKKVSDEEVAIRYITSGKEKSEEASRYASMSMEEKKAFHTKVLENLFGSVVYHNDDMEEVTEEEEKEIMAQIEAGDNDVLTLDAEVIELPVKK
jgi:hypothetical protein